MNTRRPPVRKSYRDQLSPLGYQIAGAFRDAFGNPAYMLKRDWEWFVGMRIGNQGWSITPLEDFEKRNRESLERLSHPLQEHVSV